jgi:hypothetical protein
LFQDAQNNCGFNYIAKDLSASFSTTGLRVIHIPLPTKLFVAGYMPKGTIDSSTYPLKGTGEAAMAHVFEYDGATSLKFKGKKTPAAQDSSANFHFHTVPPDDTFHGVAMFAALVKDVLSDTTVSLDATEPDAPPIPGKCLPQYFDVSELDYPTKAKTTASCAGAGLGIGG